MEGYSTPSLQWHCQLETPKLNTKIGLTFGSDFISAVFPICPSTFLMKDSQIDNKYLDFLQGEHWQPTAKNSNPNSTGVYYKLLRCPTTAKNVCGCSFPLFPVFYTSFLARFQTGTFGFINHFWKYFIFLLTPHFPSLHSSCTVANHTPLSGIWCPSFSLTPLPLKSTEIAKGNRSIGVSGCIPALLFLTWAYLYHASWHKDVAPM